MKSFILPFFFVFMILFSCRSKKKELNVKTKWSKGHSVNFNKELTIREEMQIKFFLEHHNLLKMRLSESGLRYMIYKKGNNSETAKAGQNASIKIQIKLLDGKICYETIEDDYERFVIDKSEKETGIHELVKYMSIGDKAIAILPSHLGHGLLGDRENIPPQSVLFIDVELINLEK